MARHSQSTCSACVFVSSQLRSETPCPWHAGVGYVSLSGAALASIGSDHLEHAAIGTPRLTADQPWPFTPREYARLLLLRSRLPERREALRLRSLDASHLAIVDGERPLSHQDWRPPVQWLRR